MKHVGASFALVCGVLFIYGFIASQMRLSEIDDTREYRIVVTDTAADDSYATVMVEGCSAEVTDDAGVVCSLGWYGRSDRAWTRDRETGVVSRQIPLAFRDAPKGVLLRFEAVVSDRQGKPLNSASLVTRRGF